MVPSAEVPLVSAAGLLALLEYSAAVRATAATARDGAPIDRLWVLMAALLVLLMQAGFACYQGGVGRREYADGVGMKNLTAWLLVGVVAAAVLTPPDPVTQVLVWIPMIVLYEVGIRVSGVLLRWKDEETPELPDEEERLEPAQGAIRAPLPRQLDRDAPYVAVLLELRLEPLGEGERVGRPADEADERPALRGPAHVLRAVLHHRVSHRHLTIRSHRQ